MSGRGKTLRRDNSGKLEKLDRQPVLEIQVSGDSVGEVTLCFSKPQCTPLQTRSFLRRISGILGFS